MARRFGLPVADFEIVEVPQELIVWGNATDLHDDWVERQAYADRLAATIAEFDLACDNVPPEWWWVDNGVPASFDRKSAREILRRFNDDNFWRVA